MMNVRLPIGEPTGLAEGCQGGLDEAVWMALMLLRVELAPLRPPTACPKVVWRMVEANDPAFVAGRGAVIIMPSIMPFPSSAHLVVDS